MLMNELDLRFISVVISPGAKFSWGVGNDTIRIIPVRSHE